MILAGMTATLHKPIVKIILTSWSKLNFISSVVLYKIHPCNFLKLVANALPNSCYVALEKGTCFINSYGFFLTFFSYIPTKRWSDLWPSSLARINTVSTKVSSDHDFVLHYLLVTAQQFAIILPDIFLLILKRSLTQLTILFYGIRGIVCNFVLLAYNRTHTTKIIDSYMYL